MHVNHSHAPPPIPASVGLAACLEQSPAAMVLLDHRDNAVWANRACRQLLGIGKKWDEPQPIGDFIDPDASGWLTELRVRAGSEPVDNEPIHVPMHSLDGGRFDALLRSSMVPSGDSGALLLLSVAPIVGFRYDHHPFRRALEVQQELVCEWAPHGTVLYANRAYRSFFSLGSSVVGQSLDALLERRGDPPLDGMGTSIRINIVRGVEQSTEGYRENRTYPNGRTVEWTNTGVRNAGGELMSILAVGRDVTDRTATETQLRRSEERFRMMATQIWDTILLVDAQARLIDSTAPYRDDPGRDPDFWAGTDLNALVHPDDRDEATTAFRHLVALGPGGQHSLELRCLRPDGTSTWFQLDGTNLLEHPSVEAILLSVRNIDERRQLERERADLLERERITLERREGFVNHVSHELRNLVHGTLGLSELLSRSEVPLEVREVVTTLHRQSTSLRRVVDDLLEAAELELRPDQVRTEVIDLMEVLSDIGMTFNNEAVPVVVDEPLDAARFVVGDTDRLRQALTNLVRNAVRHTTTGEVRLAAAEGQHDGTVRVTVRDTGSGIDPEDIDRLFAEYERGRNERSHGIGLGLAVARRIAQRMGGDIGAIPRPDGATFWIELRASVSTDATPSRGIPRPHSTTPLASHLRVLVLDDDPVNRLVASMQLHELDASVVTAASPDEAFDLLRQREFDAILCDLNLGRESGLNVLRTVREMPIVQPFVAIMTGDANPGNHARALQAGANHFMVKPATIADVKDTLERCVRARD